MQHGSPIRKLETTVTYLEMFARPARRLALSPREGVAIVRAEAPTVSFYRYLYNTVGASWLWGDRRKMSDAELGAIVKDPRVEIYVLYARGTPAGYAELDARKFPEIELAYFGLMPEFIGGGLGRCLIDWSIERAFALGASRFWLHTCTLDHPRALEFYRRSGFVEYDAQVEVNDDPRDLGLI